MSPDASISQRPHPKALGSALTNRFITTDYSEALLEFVTPAYSETWQTLQFLCDIHQFVYRHIGEELLWATSMPCAVGSEDGIPVARYGDSNVGRMKTIYREGLGHRYGRVMQTISGIHFNYSLPETFWPAFREHEKSNSPLDRFRSDSYFALVRNVWRYGWITLYLFGASPAMCKSFFLGRSANMPELDEGTYYEPYGTSLRMSDLGYKNKTQAGIKISLNSLDDYTRDLSRATMTLYPEYEQLGVRVNGEYRQLNANLLQIENEYYSLIRPKRVAKSGERPTRALQRGGVEYVELRALDVNAFDPVGLNQNQLRFLEVFLIFCLLQESRPMSEAEKNDIDHNHNLVARRGRQPGLLLRGPDGELPLREWAGALMDGMRGVAELLDQEEEDEPYASALQVQSELVGEPGKTPSARILEELERTGESFLAFALRTSRTHKSYFRELQPVDEARLAQFEQEAALSLKKQREIEEADKISFEQYLARYFSGGR